MHPVQLSALLGSLFGLSELSLGLLRRSDRQHTRQDRGSLLGFWILIPLAVMLSQWAAQALPRWRLQGTWPLALGLTLFIAGMCLRWYSIGYLGRWFTVDVAVHADQPLIDSGPFRHIRHPSYSGALLALIGLGLSTGHAVAAWLMWLPTLPAFGYRIHVEEAVLAQVFGARWQQYRQRSWRLLPGIV